MFCYTVFYCVLCNSNFRVQYLYVAYQKKNIEPYKHNVGITIYICMTIETYYVCLMNIKYTLVAI